LNKIRTLKQKRDAISSMVGWFLILIMLASATVIILLGTQEAVTERKNESRTGAMGKTFEEFDKNINDLLPSSPTSGKTEIAIDSGHINVDSKGDRIAVMYTYNDAFDFTVDGIENINFDDNAQDIEDSLTININAPAIDTVTKYPGDDHKDTTKLSSGSGVLIQLRHIEYPLDTATGDPDPANEDVSFGCIWIFDLGRLTYETSVTEGGVQRVIYENCAVIKDDTKKSNIEYSSNIENEANDAIQLSVGLIRGDDVTVSGGGVYNTEFEVFNNYVRNKVNTEVYNLKIMITGDYTDTWYDYLTNPVRTYTFTQPTGEDYLLFNNGAKTNLVFSTYVIKINDIHVS